VPLLPAPVPVPLALEERHKDLVDPRRPVIAVPIDPEEVVPLRGYHVPAVQTFVLVGSVEVEDKGPARTQGPAHPLHDGGELRVNENRFGSLEIEIQDVRLLDVNGNAVTSLDSGDALRVELHFNNPQKIPAPIFGVTITRADGLVCYDTSTASAALQLTELRGRGSVALKIERLDLNGGEYFVDVGSYKNDWSYAYDYHWHVYSITVEPQPGEKGILRPPHHWEIGNLEGLEEIIIKSHGKES